MPGRVDDLEPEPGAFKQRTVPQQKIRPESGRLQSRGARPVDCEFRAAQLTQPGVSARMVLVVMRIDDQPERGKRKSEMPELRQQKTVDRLRQRRIDQNTARRARNQQHSGKRHAPRITEIMKSRILHHAVRYTPRHNFSTGMPEKWRKESEKRQKNGASDRNRTGDNHVGNVMLYQLSYTRISHIRRF